MQYFDVTNKLRPFYNVESFLQAVNIFSYFWKILFWSVCKVSAKYLLGIVV